MTTTPSAHEITHLDRQLRELSDQQEIADLVNLQGRWLDEKRFDDARSIFTEDATGEFPSGPVRGADALADQALRNHRDYERTQHVTTNVLIEVAGDKATVGANLLATLVPRADVPDSHLTIGERYRFEAVRTAAGWRLSRVEVRPVWRSR